VKARLLNPKNFNSTVLSLTFSQSFPFKMLLEENIIPFVDRITKRIRNPLGWNFHSLFWHEKSERLSFRKSFPECYILGGVQIFTVFESTIALFKYDNVPYRALQSFFTAVLLVCSLMNLFLIKNSPDFCKFFNGLLEFERKYGNEEKEGKSSGTKILKLLCQLQYHSLAPLVAIVAVAAAMAPKSPFNSYSILFQANSDEINIFARAVAFSTNFAIWYLALPALNFTMTINTAIAFYALNTIPWRFYG